MGNNFRRLDIQRDLTLAGGTLSLSYIDLGNDFVRTGGDLTVLTTFTLRKPAHPSQHLVRPLQQLAI